MKKNNDNSTTDKPLIKSSNLFPVVGIGASAGGLNAFKRLLKAIPENSGMAWVLVQHLDPSHESLLPELLQKVTVIPVLEITNDIKINPDHIYIIPSNKMLIANDGKLELSRRTDPGGTKNKKSLLPSFGKPNLPIDVFFESLAEVHQSDAIGVVLSGTASDGTKGLKAIKDHGGITFAQDEESADYDGMPQSAVQAGVVDFVLPPEKIPQKLLEIFKTINRNGEEDIPLQDEDVFKQILSLLRIRKGIDFTYYKQSTIHRRIGRRMAICKHQEPVLYLKYMRENKNEQDNLYQDLLIPVTSFFRDHTVFENLCDSVFPQIIKSKLPNELIRIWVAGCSTGEEAYTIAMCCKEFLGDQASSGSDQKVQIFATDISEPAIVKARAGIYSKSEVDGISSQRLQEFFTKTNGNYQLNKQVRDMCVFAVHNFLKDPPFGKMDFISCRNVLIYMEPYLQKKALTAFHYALNPTGYLLLGKSETTGSASDLFTPAAKSDKLFTRRDTPGRFMVVASPQRESNLRNAMADPKGESIRTDFQKTADEIMLSKYTPAGVVINEAMDIVHFHGKTGAYLELASGKPSLNLIKMAKNGLGFELRNILHKAKKDKTPVIKENIPILLNGDQRSIRIEAIPLPNMVEPHYLILFHDNLFIQLPKRTTRNVKLSSKTKEEVKDLLIQQLEKELSQTREDMRSITEDQEGANEELQSANEELVSSSEELQSLNEELETGKEELQSTNEELTVVNQELVSLNDQVTEARDFSESVISTLHQPLLVLDKNMRINIANNAFYKTFQVNETETEGRMIYELGNRQWDIPALRDLLENILPEKSKILNYEVRHNFQSIGQRTILVNAREILRESTSEKSILLVFEDITERKEAEKQRSLLSTIVNLSGDAIISETLDGTINSWNRTAEKMFGYSQQEAVGKNIKLLIPEELRSVEKMMMAKIEKGQEILHFDTIRLGKDGTRINISLTLSPIKDNDGKIVGASKIARDITEQKQALTKLEESEKRYNMMLMQSPFAFAIVKGKDMVITLANDSLKEVWGKGKDIEGRPLLEVLPEIKDQPFPGLLDKVYTTGIPFSAYETPVHLVHNGRLKEVYFNFVYQPYRESDGTISGVAIIASEVTPQAVSNKKIKESEALFRQLAELMPDKVSSADAEGNIIYYNHSWLNYTGYLMDELKDNGWKKVIHMDDLDELTKRWLHSIETGDDFEMEFRILNKNGIYHWHLCRSMAIKDDEGKIGKWISTTTNIQTQKQQREELEKSVQERTTELSAANTKLKEKNEDLIQVNKELESFTYVSSHDLQEPLRKIQTFATRILEKEYAALSDKGKDYFQRMQSAANRMQQLIEDLLIYSRAGTGETVVEKTDLNLIVEEVKNELAESIEVKNAVIENGNLCDASINPILFRQVMNNLIGNALKFSKPGIPPHVIIKSEIGEGIQFRNEALGPDKMYCHLSVSDHGIGFEPEFNERIFQLFQRLHTRDEYPGTGIGLAIVKKIIENHNGIITASGELNEGVTFDIYLPMI